MTGKLVEIFIWNPKGDRIHPEIVDAVIERSLRLKALENLWGWDEARLKSEMGERMIFEETDRREPLRITTTLRSLKP